MEKVKNKTFEIYSYLSLEGSPEEIMEKIIEKVPNLDNIGYAGYLKKDWLMMTLKRLMLDKEENNQSYVYNTEYEKKIKLICREIIKKCEKYIDEKTHIFLFPTFDKFAIEKMRGVSGFCPWNNTILIFINFINGWEKQFEETIVHELAHALSPFAKPDAQIGPWLILEGLAEHFKDSIIKQDRSPWTKAISEEESWKIFDEIKNSLEKSDFDKYSEIFYGTGKYPLWAGYTIGYFLVKRYLEKFPNFDWKELLKKDPEKILKETKIINCLIK